MLGDDFIYWAQDRCRDLDDIVRELNEWFAQHWAAWVSQQGGATESSGGEASFPLPVVAEEFFNAVVGENPRADEHELTSLAEYWRDEAEKTQDVAAEINQSAAGVQVVWSGDGAPWVFQDNLREVALSVNALATTESGLASQVTEFATTVIQAKAAFRAAFVLLLVELAVYIYMAVPTWGASMAAAGVRVAVTVGRIAASMSNFLSKLGLARAANALRPLSRKPAQLASRPSLTPQTLPPLRYSPRAPALGAGPGARSVPSRQGWRQVAQGIGQRLPQSVRSVGSGVGSVARRLGNSRAGKIAGAPFVRAAANRRAAQEQRRMYADRARELSQSGRPLSQSARKELAALKSRPFRRELAHNIAAAARGNPLSAGRGASRLSSDMQQLAQSTARQVVDNGFSASRVIGSALKSYTFGSGALFGGGGWVLQETMTHASLSSAGVKDLREDLGMDPYRSHYSSLAAAVVGAGLGGAPLAFGTTLPSMMVLGGVGGALGHVGSTLTEVALNPDIEFSEDMQEQLDPRMLRAGGAGDLRTAILQGAFGGAWEHRIGAASMAEGNVAWQNWVNLSTLDAGPAGGGGSGISLATGPPSNPPPGPPGDHTSQREKSGPPPDAAPDSHPRSDGPPGHGDPGPVEANNNPPGPDSPQPQQSAQTEQSPQTPEGGERSTNSPPPSHPDGAKPSPHPRDDSTATDNTSPAEADPAKAHPPPAEATEQSPARGTGGDHPAPAGQRQAAGSDGTTPSASAQVGDVWRGKALVTGPPKPPTSASVAPQLDGEWSPQLQQAATEVAEQAFARPSSSEHWKPVEGGWLVQGEHESTSMVVRLDAQGTIRNAWRGEFAPVVTDAAAADSALTSFLADAQVRDEGTGARATPLPDGSTIDAVWGTDPRLPEGVSVITPGTYTLTPAGWQQSSPATVTLSTSVRDHAAERADDVARQADLALARLAAGLPGPVGASGITAQAGHAPAAADTPHGQVHRPHRRWAEISQDHTGGPHQSTPDAGEQLAAAIAAIQHGAPSNSPVVAITGDPAQGAKLAHFADGSTATFTIETTPHLPPGTAAVRPGSWAHDGAEMRQMGAPVHLQISDQLPIDVSRQAATTQLTDLLDTSLRLMHETLPDPDRPHDTHNLLDMQQLGDTVNPRPDPRAPIDLSQSTSVFVLPDPLPGDLTDPSRVDSAARYLLRVPGTDDFAAQSQSLVDAMEQAGYQIDEVVSGWSQHQTPGILVRAHTPPNDAQPGRPIEVRLLTPDALDAYRSLADQAVREQLPEPEVRRTLAGHAFKGAPEGTENVRPAATQVADSIEPAESISEQQPRPHARDNGDTATQPGPAEADPPPGTLVDVEVSDQLAKLSVPDHHDQFHQRVNELLAPADLGRNPLVESVPGLEAATPQSEHSADHDGAGLWQLTYQGRTVLVEIAPDDSLKPGQALVKQGRIELSSHTLEGTAGNLVALPVLTQALSEYGNLVPGGERAPLTALEYWQDPPWRSQQRRPSMDELLPSTDAEARAHGDAVSAELAQLLDGEEFAGMHVAPDSDRGVRVSEHRVEARLNVIDPETGQSGHLALTAERDQRGSLVVTHHTVQLEGAAREGGFAAEFFGFLEQWYQYSGVERVTVHADSTTAQFVRVLRGFEWEPNPQHGGPNWIGVKPVSDAGVQYARPPLPDEAATYSTDSDVPGAEWSSTGARDDPAAQSRAEAALAEASYERFRADGQDVADIAHNLQDIRDPNDGQQPLFTYDRVEQIKTHLMRREHLLYDGEGGLHRRRFAPDLDVALAWQRLREGNRRWEDVVLLRHELHESEYLRANPDALYYEAHSEANKVAPWEAMVPERTAQDLERLHHEGEVHDGNTADVSEGPGGSGDRGVSVRPGQGDGPEAGIHQGDSAGAGAGREERPEPSQDPLSDPAGSSEPRPVADSGDVRRVEPHHRAAEKAVSDALRDLARDVVGDLAAAQREGDTVRVTAQTGETLEVPVGDLINRLANSVDTSTSDPAAAQRLRAEAAAELADRLTHAATGTGHQLGPRWDPASELATARVLARLHDLHQEQGRTAYLDALDDRLGGLGADQIAQLAEESHSDAVRARLHTWMADALLRETMAALSGPDPGALAIEIRWRGDKGVTLTRGLLRGRHIPAGEIDGLRDWIRSRLADGVHVDGAQAELAAVLGAEHGPEARARRPRVVKALNSLAQLYHSDTPSAPRDEIRRQVSEILASYQLDLRDQRALTDHARDLVDRSPSTLSVQDDAGSLQVQRHTAAAEAVHEVARQLGGERTLPPPDRRHQLAENIQQLHEVLDAAQDALARRQAARQELAEEAQQEAQKAQEKADQEQSKQGKQGRRVNDQWTRHRRDTAEFAAGQHHAVAARHDRIAGRYGQARDAAATAHDAYLALSEHLASLDQAAPAELPGQLAQLHSFASEAREAYRAYQQAIRRTQPVALELGVPPDRLPYLNALTDRVNAMLAAQGRGTQLEAVELHRLLRQGWTQAASRGAEGFELPAGLGGPGVRITFRPGDAVEVVNPPQRAAEIIHAQLPQFPKGNRTLGAAGNRKLDRNVDFSLGDKLAPLADTIPDDPDGYGAGVRWFLRHLVLDVSRGAGNRWSVSGTAMPRYVVPGQVSNTRGDSTMYSVDGHFEIRVRGEDGEWSQAERVDRPLEGDATEVRVVVEHAYTEAAPESTVQLPPGVKRASFPEHSALQLSGLHELYSRLEDMFESKSSVTNEQLSALVYQEFPARLAQSINHEDGYEAVVYERGRPAYLVQIKTDHPVAGNPDHEYDASSAPTLLGRRSNQHHLEQLRVSFAGYSGATEVGSSRSSGLSSGLTALPHDQQDATGGNASGGPSYTRSSTTQAGLGGGTTAIRPNVQRYTGFTQAYQLNLRHTVTVTPLDDAPGPQRSDVVYTDGIYRLTELEAYRTGLPVDRDAVRRDASGNEVRHDHDNRYVLHDDLIPGAPDGRLAQPPQWLVDEAAIPGAGMALVKNATGVNEAAATAMRSLRADGWTWSMNGQSGGVQALAHQLSSGMLLKDLAELVEGNLDQAAQAGLPLEFTRKRRNHAPEHLSVRVRVEQRWENAVPLGHGRGYTDVSLDIANQRLTQQWGESRTGSGGLSGSLEAGSGRARSVGPAEVTGGAGAGVTGQKTYTSGTGHTEAVNHVVLTEAPGDGHTMWFRVPHTVTVVALNPDGTERPLTEPTEGSAEVGVSADMLPPEPSRRPPLPAPAADPDARAPASVLAHAKLLHFDSRGLWEATQQVLPRGTKPGSAARLHLQALTDVRNLIANKWWQYGEMGTDLAVDPRGATPHRSSLRIQGEVGPLRFLQPINLVALDAHLTMRAEAVSYGEQSQASATTTATGEAVDLAELGGSGGTDQSRATSHTATRTYAREQLIVENSVHYVYDANTDITLTGKEHYLATGGDESTTKIEGRRGVYAIPERIALQKYAEGELPVPPEQVVDALRRWANGSVTLERKTVVGVLARFHQDVDAAGVETPHYMPSRVLYAPDALARRMADRLKELFPDVAEPASARVSKRIHHYVEQGLQEQVPAVPAALTAKVQLPDHLQQALGIGGIEPGTVFTADDNGTPRIVTDLSSEVLKHIEEVVPGLVDASQVLDSRIEIIEAGPAERTPGLEQSLRGQLAGNAWTGKVDRMLRPDGWEVRLPIRMGQTLEYVQVKLTAELSDPVPIGHSDTTGVITQDYAYREEDSSESRSGSHGGGGALTAAEYDQYTGGAGFDRGYTVESASSTQHTRIQRASQIQGGVDRWRRHLTIDVEVTREPPQRRGDVARQALEHVGRGQVKTQSSGTVEGAVVHLVPPDPDAPSVLPTQQSDSEPHSETTAPATDGAAASTPTGTTASEPGPFHAPSRQLPHMFLAEVVDPGDLSASVLEVLRHPQLLGQVAVNEHQTTLAGQLSPLTLPVALQQMLENETGHQLDTFPVPGHPREQVQVLIKAEVVGDVQRIYSGRQDLEIGLDERKQDLLKSATSSDQAKPLDRSVQGTFERLLGPTTEVSTGDSSSYSYESRRGDRDERKIYQKGEGGTAAVQLRFSVTALRKDVHTGQELFRTTALRIAHGEAFAITYDTDQAAMQSLPGRTLSVLDEGRDGPGSERPRWARRLGLPGRPAPSFVLHDLVGAETAGGTSAAGAAGAQGSGTRAPHQAAAAALRSNLGEQAWQDTPLIHLTAHTDRLPHGADALSTATRLAVERGGAVVVDLREADGTLRQYQAQPNGALIPARPDGGFADAWTALHTAEPDLIDRANQAGLNLRALFHQSVADNRPFPTTVRDSLAQPPPPGDTSTTATELAGAPGSGGQADPAGTAAAMAQELTRRAGEFEQPPTPHQGKGLLVVPKGADYALRFDTGPARDGLRGFREPARDPTARDLQERLPDGRPIIQVTVVDSIPVGEQLSPQLTQRDIWIRRIVVHEIAEAAAVAERERLGVPPGQPDALARGADPALTERTAHDEAHRAEVIDLVNLLTTMRRDGQVAAAREADRQLGLLLDELGVGVPNPNAPDAQHADSRMAVLDLPRTAAEEIEPLRGPRAEWRATEPSGEPANQSPTTRSVRGENSSTYLSRTFAGQGEPNALEIFTSAGQLHIYDPAAARELLPDLLKIPSEIARTVAVHGVDIHIGRGNATDFGPDTYLKDAHPRGHPTGVTWSEVPGMYNPIHHRLTVGTGTTHASYSLLLHEFGHALDHALGAPSSDSLFRQVYDRHTPTAPYFTLSDPDGVPRAGLKETWAELFAIWIDTGGTGPAWGQGLAGLGITEPAAAARYDDYFREVFGWERRMYAERLPDGRLRVATRIETEDGSIGDGMMIIDSDHPHYAQWENYLRQQEQLGLAQAGHWQAEPPNTQDGADHEAATRRAHRIAAAVGVRDIKEVNKAVFLRDAPDHHSTVDLVTEALGRQYWISEQQHMHQVGLNSSSFRGVRERLRAQLLIAQSNPDYHANGLVPGVVIYFPDGVTPEMADALERVRATGRDGKPLPDRVRVLGQRVQPG